MNSAAVQQQTQEIVVEEVFPHAPELVWKTLTIGKLITRWLMEPSGFEPVVGNRFTAADLMDNVPEAQIALFRKKSTDKKAMEALASHLFTSDESLGTVRDIDLTDCPRISFTSGDIIHFRPSNNAPQFRVYTNASTQERANELVYLSLKPGGYVEQILQAIT